MQNVSHVLSPQTKNEELRDDRVKSSESENSRQNFWMATDEQGFFQAWINWYIFVFVPEKYYLHSQTAYQA